MIGGTSTIAANVGLYPKRKFDPLKNLTPIMEIGTSSFLMAVPASSPAKNVHDFIEQAKAGPGQRNYGSSGNGSSMHLMGEMFELAGDKVRRITVWKSSGKVMPSAAA